jgi:hypothetical protein
MINCNRRANYVKKRQACHSATCKNNPTIESDEQTALARITASDDALSSIFQVLYFKFAIHFVQNM